VFREACKLGCEGIVSKRLGSRYRPERSAHWVKVKNPKAPPVTREAAQKVKVVREVVIVALAGFLIGIIVAAVLVHFLS
jgi:ATP-dependent DNA ligase